MQRGWCACGFFECLTCIQQAFFHNTTLQLRSSDMTTQDLFALVVGILGGSALEAIAVLISVLGVGLTIMRSMWCWVVNLIAVLIYAVLFFQYKLYGETVLQILFMGMNIYGFLTWMRGQAQQHEIRIQPIQPGRALQQILVAMSGGLIFGLILKNFTDAAVPLLDAQLAALSVLGTYWTSQRYIATWMLWVAVDIVYVGMFAYKELYLTAVLYTLFVGLAAYGWWQWVQVKKQQATQVSAV